VPDSTLLCTDAKISCVGYAELSYQAIDCPEDNFID